MRSDRNKLLIVHFCMIAGVVASIVMSTVAVHRLYQQPFAVTFYEHLELRWLCFSWASLGLLIMSLELNTGWIVPATLLGMWLLAILPQFNAMQWDPEAGRIMARYGIFIGLGIGLFIETVRR